MSLAKSMQHRRPLVALALAAILVLSAAALYYMLSRRAAPTAALVEWASRDAASRARHVYDLPVRRTDGLDYWGRGVPVPEISAGAGEVLFMMSLDFVDEFGAWYRVAIDDFVGDPMWEEAIPEEFLRGGHCFIRLKTATLAPGTYAIEIIEIEDDGFSDLIAESAFRVVD